jgi:hypothetical protein
MVAGAEQLRGSESHVVDRLRRRGATACSVVGERVTTGGLDDLSDGAPGVPR